VLLRAKHGAMGRTIRLFPAVPDTVPAELQKQLKLHPARRQIAIDGIRKKGSPESLPTVEAILIKLTDLLTHGALPTQARSPILPHVLGGTFRGRQPRQFGTFLTHSRHSRSSQSVATLDWKHLRSFATRSRTRASWGSVASCLPAANTS
jgi:hypothetical protein